MTEIAQHTSPTPEDIRELKAIYEDYLYIVRQHELVFDREKNIDPLSAKQVKEMYPHCKDPLNFVIPWYIEKLNSDEEQKFADYIKNNIPGDGHTTYVSMQHIKADENNGEAPVFAIEPYHNISIATLLPSTIEKYTLSFPQGATLGNTEFHIDGRYKALYFGADRENQPLTDYINDEDLITELTVMLYLGEAYRKNGYKENKEFKRKSVHIYAEEMLRLNENHLLEIFSSFAEMVRKICHARYHQENSSDDIKKAQEEGFLNLPDNFQDYLNIRDLLRHQWDTLYDLDDFSLEQSQENKRVRTERVNSYLNFCNKSLYQRMKYGLDVLHHMQQIICSVEPHRIIRDETESNTKFIKRVKAACQKNPDIQIEVELNIPLEDRKWRYDTLSDTFHKKKLFPNIKLIDDCFEDPNKFEVMANYKKRSLFLRSFHSIESFAMEYCQRRGEDMNNRGAWKYLKKNGIITPEECDTWQEYTNLRNALAHNYFDVNLQKRLNDEEKKYEQDSEILSQKVRASNPIGSKVQDDVYSYKHNDGMVSTVDYNSHEREINEQPSKHQEQAASQNREHKSGKKSGREYYRNGIEFNIKKGELVGVKFPNAVYINMIKQNINWGENTHWYTNAQHFNILQTDNSIIRTNKELKVTRFPKGNRPTSSEKPQSLLIDGLHTLLLDDNGHIEEFDFKDEKNKIIKAKFKHTESNQSDLISFNDGTTVLFSENEVIIRHNNQLLSYDNRKEFAKTYDNFPVIPHHFIKHDKGR